MIRVYMVTPVAKPRQTRRDKWQQRPSVMKYRAFADKCRSLDMVLPPDGSAVEFVLPMPKSWSKRKKAAMVGRPHLQKPDLDNLKKALCDALHGDDSHIHTMAGRKVWGDTGRIEIRPWRWPWAGEKQE